VVGFSFQGTELIGIAAGEADNPSKSIPRAVKQVFWRILLFYIFVMAVIGTLLPYTSPQLMSNSVTTSPFTLVFTQAGFMHMADIMNAVILIAILSAGNSGMYASTRMLCYLARQGHVPAYLGKINARGIPMNALLVTAAVGLLAFLCSIYGDGTVYMWLLNASSLSGFIAWFGIAISHYRFRRAYLRQGGKLSDLPYVAKGYPWAPLLAMALCLIVIFGQGFVTGDSKVSVTGLVVTYFGLPIFVGLWLGYKWRHKTKLIPLELCDMSREKVM
jgi:lysine-specific permease